MVFKDFISIRSRVPLNDFSERDASLINIQATADNWPDLFLVKYTERINANYSQTTGHGLASSIASQHREASRTGKGDREEKKCVEKLPNYPSHH